MGSSPGGGACSRGPAHAWQARVTFSNGKFHLAISDVTTGRQRKVSKACKSGTTTPITLGPKH